MDWNGHNKTKPGRTGPQPIQPEHGKTDPGRTDPVADRNHPEGSNKKIRAACPSTYGPAGIKAPSDPICAEVRTGRIGSPDDYFQRSRGYLPSAIIFSMAAIRAGLSSL